MQNRENQFADIQALDSDYKSLMVPRHFVDTDDIVESQNDWQADSIYAASFFATLDRFVDNSENHKACDLHNTVYRHSDDGCSENQQSMSNNSSPKIFTPREPDSDVSRGHNGSATSTNIIVGKCAGSSLDDFDCSDHITETVVSLTSDSPGDPTQVTNVDYIGMYRRLLEEENANRKGNRKRKIHEIDEGYHTKYGYSSPAQQTESQDTAFGALRLHHQVPCSNFANIEVGNYFDLGSSDTGTSEREIQKDNLAIDFRASSYILFPEKHGNVFPAQKGNEGNDTNCNRLMDPFRDESDEDGDSVRAGGCKSEYENWNIVDDSENCEEQSEITSENERRRKLSSQDVSFQAGSSELSRSQSLSSTAVPSATNLMDLSTNSDASDVTPKLIQRSASTRYSFPNDTVEKWGEKRPLKPDRAHYESPVCIRVVRGTPLPRGSDRFTMHPQRFAVSRQIRHVTRGRNSLGKGKRGPKARARAQRRDATNTQCSNRVPFSAGNVTTTPSTTADTASNTPLNKGLDPLTTVASVSPGHAVERHIDLPTSRGRVEKHRGSKARKEKLPGVCTIPDIKL